MGHHAKRHGIPCAPPYFPSSLLALVRAHAANTSTSTNPGRSVGLGGGASASIYSGKRSLTLSGTDDAIAVGGGAHRCGGAGRRAEERKEIVPVRGAKHELTDEMSEVLFRCFFWEEKLGVLLCNAVHFEKSGRMGRVVSLLVDGADK
jgi:hypothetical protein